MGNKSYYAIIKIFVYDCFYSFDSGSRISRACYTTFFKLFVNLFFFFPFNVNHSHLELASGPCPIRSIHGTGVSPRSTHGHVPGPDRAGSFF